MNKNFAQELEMFEQTNAYLDDHISVWIAVPIIINYKNKIHQLFPLLKSSLNTLETDTSKVHMGQAILHLKKQIADKMDILDDTLEAYADDVGDEQLRQAASNYYMDYFRLPYDDFTAKVVEMIGLLEKHIDKMAEYGLVHDQIDDVKLNMTEYQESLDKEPTFNIPSTVLHDNVEELLDQARAYSQKLDKVMKRFKRSNVTFYNGYLAARTIVEY